jgi:dolichyl-phosphate-mannose--protein O-mannosyl transferase
MSASTSCAIGGSVIRAPHRTTIGLTCRSALAGRSEFTQAWWAWLVATGVFLAFTISCKMVGLFMFLTVGSAVIVDLWNILDVRRGLTMVSDLRPHAAVLRFPV